MSNPQNQHILPKHLSLLWTSLKHQLSTSFVLHVRCVPGEYSLPVSGPSSHQSHNVRTH